MSYLFDSDWVIDLLADVPEAVTLLDRLAAAGVSMSVVTYMEAYQGTIREADPATAQATLEILAAAMPIVPVTPAVARRCAFIRETLRLRQKRVGPRALDLIIAATALEVEAILVTRNARDYRDIPELRLYQST